MQVNRSLESTATPMVIERPLNLAFSSSLDILKSPFAALPNAGCQRRSSAVSEAARSASLVEGMAGASSSRTSRIRHGTLGDPFLFVTVSTSQA